MILGDRVRCCSIKRVERIDDMGSKEERCGVDRTEGSGTLLVRKGPGYNRKVRSESMTGWVEARADFTFTQKKLSFSFYFTFCVTLRQSK